MENCFANMVSSGFSPEPDAPVLDSIFQQYERVIVESLISSFGLDFLIKDQHGGDVDTIHNVRKIGDEPDSDPNMIYKNKANETAYQNRGSYDASEYHEKNNTYKSIRNQAKKAFNEQGQWIEDAYTGSKIGINKALPDEKRAQLDHVISAKSIHDDRGRVLAGISGSDLANDPDNLRFTNMKLNNNMKDKDIKEYIEWSEKNPEQVNWNGKKGEPLSDDVKKNLMEEYNQSKKVTNRKINQVYYTSSQFLKDTTKAAGTVGLQMGARQTVGLVFAEIWFSVKEEFDHVSMPFEMNVFLTAIGNGIKNGFNNAKVKYKELLNTFKDGAISGVLSSLTTTLCNIFFTTAKKVVKIIRQSYAAMVKSSEILFLNPDNLPFGERMRAASKILATGASVVIGSLVTEAIEDTGIKAIPFIGEIVPTFCGTLITGILTCSLLYYLDRSTVMNRLVSVLNDVPTFSSQAEYFRSQAIAFEQYAAELMQIDLQKFKDETAVYSTLAISLSNAKDNIELNTMLKQAVKEIGIEIPWGTDFNGFMEDKSKQLVFK
ncbi:hypothetical protein [Lacrimispora sp.]|uniref:hypothetical protein n=1 Tax=Lacrimispora sp. TaxID=2719234 RepID=UPI003993DF81